MALYDQLVAMGDYDGSGNDEGRPNLAAQRRAYFTAMAPPGMVPLSVSLGVPEGYDPASNPVTAQYLNAQNSYRDPQTGQIYVLPDVDTAIIAAHDATSSATKGASGIVHKIGLAAPFLMAGGVAGLAAGGAGAAAGGAEAFGGAGGSEALIGGAGVDTLGAAAGEGLLAGEAGFLPGSFELGAGAGLDAAAGGGFSLADLANVPTGGFGGGGGGGGGNSLSDFQNTLQQSGVMGDSGGLSELFNSIDGAGGGGLNYANLLRGALQGGLGYLGAGQQADAYKDVYDQQMAIGAPFRQKLEASYAPGFDLKTADPLYGNALTQSADEATRAVSAKSGNPYGNPGAMAEIQNSVMNRTALPYTSNYRGQLGQFGGLGLNTAGTASLAGASTAGGGLNAIGYGLGTALEDDKDDQYTRLAKAIQGGQYKLSLG